MIEGLLAALANTLSTGPLLILLAGTALGVLIGSLPGLSSPMAIIVLLPITYSMETISAFQLMIGIYVGTKLGGSYASILLRAPGAPAAACTALDGFPMAQKGKPGEAIGYSVMSSTMGGVLGWIVAVTFVPLISGVALYSGPADIALIGIAGLLLVSAFARGSMVRGLIGVVIGLMIASVGTDVQDGIERYTFGYGMLASGLPFAAVIVGFFGIAVVLSDMDMIDQSSDFVSNSSSVKLPKFGDFFRRWRAWTIGTAYGVVVGAIPGVGADGSTFLAYATVRNQSKDPTPEEFGTGVPEGVIAPESSNNATTGGTMIPMLTLGIPGDGSTAVILGAMILHGLEPGVLLMQNNAPLVYSILAAILVATLMMFLVGWVASSCFIRILRQDRSLLFPFVMVFATVGAYASENGTFPIYVAACCGLAGFFLERRGFSIVTIVLGAVLGPVIEYNVRLALAFSNGEWGTFFSTWPRVILSAVLVFLIANEIRQMMRRSQLN